MPIDTSIYGLIGRGVKSVADYDNEYAQAEQNKLNNLMNGAKLDEYKRGVADQNVLRAALAGGADPYAAQLKVGNIKGATDYAKAQADIKKTGADTDETVAKTGKVKLEASNLALTQHRAMLNNVTDPDSAKQWLVAAYQNPDTKFIFERFGSLDEALKRFDQSVRDPASFAKWKMGASMNADELVKYTTPDANAKLQSDTSIKTTGMNNATSIQTTGMTNATSRANNAANLSQADRHFQAGQNAPEYKQDADGNWIALPKKLAPGQAPTAVPVLGADGKPLAGNTKPLNDSQSKANLFGTRMQEADKVLTAMADKGVLRSGAIKGLAEGVGNVLGLGTESMGGALADAAGSATNWTQSAEQQQVEQAQRDFINATLRRESGASISPAEFRNANKQYFPQPNDDPETLALKARNRQIATQGVLSEVPEKQRMKVPAPAPVAPPTPPKAALPPGWNVQVR